MAALRRVGDSTDLLGEGPVWCPHEQALYWVDIMAPAVRRWRAGSGENSNWPMPESVGSLALCASGGILVALASALSVFDPATGAIKPVATPRDDGADMRFNDGKCDRQGRFWVGTMPNGPRAPRGRLYRLDAKAGCTAVLDGISVPNSLCWSPDGRTMYFADSELRTIWAFPYDPATGALGERRVFTRTEPPEAPDGGTVDAEGYLWSARYGGGRIVRHAPDGRIDRVIELPVRQVTSCAFGGADLSTLFITSLTRNATPEQRAAQPLAGTLLAIEVGVRGLPEPRYAG
jgi:sugar lactone lactonase YvrE